MTRKWLGWPGQLNATNPNDAASLGVTIESALVRLEYVDPERIGQAKAAAFGYKFVELDGLEIPHTVVEMVPESVARENMVMPFSFQSERLLVAVNDPSNTQRRQ